ncbi:hypothetical protein HMSSN036_11390 [Paenibacillus macerans]|nr:hypothetical protein HMSSN036_11390 [Paenibacillus macerans]
MKIFFLSKRKARRSWVHFALTLILLISSVPMFFLPAAYAAEGDYLLSLNRPVYSSSSLGGNTPDMAVDGNENTRWESVWQKDPQWIYVDLGKRASISKISVKWENAYATSFELQVSDDEIHWKPVYATTQGEGGLTEVDKLAEQGRYVRVYSTDRAQKGLRRIDLGIQSIRHRRRQPAA